ncbi:pentatricopeptide repeat-containing protein At5g04780, mitochondrial [Eucalyptus grandis]|uniref:pentatricopeptide repeat-containing protein At5g04780, mitochondrial n=1 Tax=Eucalyptus grandis TaxID=71139 RepID=UPI00192EBCC9|nr:pentatricopeptide repeat-containing protein At5g04780, mitochondrial [Eucalyptus grandis]
MLAPPRLVFLLQESFFPCNNLYQCSSSLSLSLSTVLLMACLPSLSLAARVGLDPSSLRSRVSGHVSPLAVEKPPGICCGTNNASASPTATLEVESLDFREGLSVLEDGTGLGPFDYVPLLQECMERRLVSDAEAVHAHIIKTGACEDLYVMTFLVNVYAQCGAMIAARKVFDGLPRRNVVTWTTLITGYVHNSEPELAIRVYLEMLETGSYPTNYTLGIALNACSSLRSLELGKQIHAYIVKYRIEQDASIGNALCSLYSKFGNLDYAVKTFRGITEKNVISWTAIISACSENGKAASGLSFFSEMLWENVEPNEFTLTCVLSLCCTVMSLSLGKQVHSLSIKRGYQLNLPVRNSAMYLYLKCGLVDEAYKLFNEIESSSLVTWNAIIAGHVQIMDFASDNLSAYQGGTRALEIFLRMIHSGLKPDLFTFSSVLTLCSKLVAQEQGEQIHAQTIKTGCLSDVVVGSALVNMYSKCGSIRRASKAFVEMSTRTLISWTTMITNFAIHGKTQQALQLFEDMRLVGVKPNQITFVGVLAACGHSLMVDEALNYFEMMQKEYRIKPVMDHFELLVDMFVMSGRIDEAFDLIKKMHYEPNEFIWSALITGARLHRNPELGLYAAERLIKLEPRDSETCIPLLKMYRAVERWIDMSNVEKLMRELQPVKLRDWSWICIKGKVYSFEPNEQFCPGNNMEMHMLLEDLLGRAKTLGYEFSGSSELKDNEDANISSRIHQSEEFAIAFGLLNTPKAAPIQIIKNTSMCQNCHDFIKCLSILTARKIVIQDRKRLHKFVDGKCSCGDFWGLL